MIRSNHGPSDHVKGGRPARRAISSGFSNGRFEQFIKALPPKAREAMLVQLQVAARAGSPAPSQIELLLDRPMHITRAQLAQRVLPALRGYDLEGFYPFSVSCDVSGDDGKPGSVRSKLRVVLHKVELA